MSAQALEIPAPPQTPFKVNQEKWGAALMKAGYTVVPSILIERQQALGLSATDLNILLHLLRHWWYADKLPYPSKKTIATCMGITPRTVQRRIAAMERDGLLKRVLRSHPTYGKITNEYDLSGLIAEATPFAEEAIKLRDEKKKERVDRRSRKRPVNLKITH